MKAVVLSSLSPKWRARLEETLEVVYAGWATHEPVLTPLPTDEEILAIAGEASAIIVPGELSARVINGCPDLRVIGVARGDPRGVDLPAATARGIPVVYAAGRNASAVADLTLAFIIMLLRKLIPAHLFVSERRWESWDELFATTLINGLEADGRVLGLVGFGHIGQEVAQRARAFNMRVLAFDPYVPSETIVRYGAEKAGLGELLTQSDIVSVHSKLSDETRGMIGASEIGLMKPGAFLVNTARAAIVDQEALVDGLQTGHLGGVALDVYWEEPLHADSPIIGLGNVIHTPHIGGATVDVEERTAEIVATDVLSVLQGGRPRHIANPEVFSEEA